MIGVDSFISRSLRLPCGVEGRLQLGVLGFDLVQPLVDAVARLAALLGLSRQPPELAHGHDQVGGVHLDNISRGMVANPDGDTLHGFLDGRPLGVAHAHHAIQMTIAAMPMTA